jgi:hypothetical protein
MWPDRALYAVTYKGLAEDGTLYFVCDHSCGRVRVKKTDKNLYRVYSIGYSGDLAARSAEEAARKACDELDIKGSKRVSPKPSRGGGGC